MSRPTYDDANLVLKLYDLRREERLRQARAWFAGNFKGIGTMEQFTVLCPPGSDPHASYRMVTTYWEMAASFVTSGVLHEQLFYESARELLLVWERVRDLVPAYREWSSDPSYLKNLEAVGLSFANRLRTIAPEAYEAFAKRVRG